LEIGSGDVRELVILELVDDLQLREEASLEQVKIRHAPQDTKVAYRLSMKASSPRAWVAPEGARESDDGNKR
jgi:hypothetical protein